MTDYTDHVALRHNDPNIWARSRPHKVVLGRDPSMSHMPVHCSKTDLSAYVQLWFFKKRSWYRSFLYITLRESYYLRYLKLMSNLTHLTCVPMAGQLGVRYLNGKGPFDPSWTLIHATLSMVWQIRHRIVEHNKLVTCVNFIFKRNTIWDGQVIFLFQGGSGFFAVLWRRGWSWGYPQKWRRQWRYSCL